MSEAGYKIAPVQNVHRLSDAIREMKNAAADREDVAVDMREASRTRLQLLAEELQPVFAEVPDNDPAFDFALSSGEQPRLWIDAVAHVTMGRDLRTYRFLRDTRLGRTVLAESSDMKPVADQVTRYIAERMVERARMLEGDVEALPRGRDEAAAGVSAETRVAPARGGWRAFASALFFVLLGGVFGVAMVLFAMMDRFPEVSALLR